jgi:predicted NBD/HSP70 family sugar kinase
MAKVSGTKTEKTLVIDVGGSHVKMLVTGRLEPRKIPSGPKLTPALMVEEVKRTVKDWEYNVVSIGLPGPVIHGRLLRDPPNLGKGWVGFDFGRAFGCPVKVINDAAMQAIGSYRGGHMLFLGLGTGLGSAMIVDGVVEPIELAHLPYKKRKTYEDYVGLRGLERMGEKKWRPHAIAVVELLRTALDAEYVVLGGGNAKKLAKRLPPKTFLGDNRNAFLGGFRLWKKNSKVKADQIMHIRQKGSYPIT